MSDLADELHEGGSDEVEEPQREGYLANSRSLVNSLVLAAPLFALYQVGILFTDGWKNGVDFVTARLYTLVDQSTAVYLVVNVAILMAILAAARLIRSHRRLSLGTWLFVLVESLLYASLLGGVITRLLSLVGIRPIGLAVSALDNVVLSLGAGAYEELVFRLLLMSFLLWAGRRLKLEGLSLFAAAFVLSSLLFSAAHYPPFGSDPWTLWTFSYRIVAGLLFALIYVSRGFAIAAYTHALYDIHVLVLN